MFLSCCLKLVSSFWCCSVIQFSVSWSVFGVALSLVVAKQRCCRGNGAADPGPVTQVSFLSRWLCQMCHMFILDEFRCRVPVTVKSFLLFWGLFVLVFFPTNTEKLFSKEQCCSLLFTLTLFFFLQRTNSWNYFEITLSTFARVRFTWAVSVLKTVVHAVVTVSPAQPAEGWPSALNKHWNYRELSLTESQQTHNFLVCAQI